MNFGDSVLVAQKVFKSKSRDSVVGYGGGVKAKDIRGPSRTRVELEVELNATRKKNEVLVNHVTTVETENESLRNRVEAVEAEMGKFNDWVSKQLNINISSYVNTENGNPDLGRSLLKDVAFIKWIASRCLKTLEPHAEIYHSSSLWLTMQDHSTFLSCLSKQTMC
ncbi:hypothetical protein Cgig2_027232 [Carnegiea gigantea]|uniref:Uncharacterized protein n=1 Tax=Carnegiea gigantea TaxID=171969 RepID=A0A9Q1GUA7_9CARY|nr:hypothetical protein Cgig2_027232 [Carnegiea gigantea]